MTETRKYDLRVNDTQTYINKLESELRHKLAHIAHLDKTLMEEKAKVSMLRTFIREAKESTESKTGKVQ